MEYIDKEVDFHTYCEICKHKATSEDADPCHDCLNNPTNAYSHKPVYFEEDKNARRK